MRIAIAATVAIAALTLNAGAYTISDESGTAFKDGAALQRILSSIADRFMDPDAVEFRRLKAGNGNLCGELNAKNAHGAYVGYEPFYNLSIERDLPPPPMIGSWTTACD